MQSLSNISSARPSSPLQNANQPETSKDIPGSGWVDDYDFSVIDHSREMYFLPGVDRLAAGLVEQSQQKMKVRVEAQDQVVEYVLDGKNRDADVTVSLNGKPYELKSTPQPDGSSQFNGQGPAGNVNLSVNYSPNTSHAGALIKWGEDSEMALTDKLITDPDPNSPRPYEIIGNFACARMYQEILREPDGFQILGDLGSYPIDGRLSKLDNGGYLIEGHLGELKYKQTITPLEPGPAV